MPITDESGQPINVEEANSAFARAMLPGPQDNVPVAPAPPKRSTATRTAPKPAAKTTRATAKKDASKVVSAPAPATPKLHEKRAQSGADILNQLGLMATVAYATTDNDAWQQDAKVLTAAAETFGEACANLAEHNPSFARYLDSEGSGAAGAYLGFGLVTAQISLALIDNHGARSKVPGFIKTATAYIRIGSKKILKGKKSK